MMHRVVDAWRYGAMRATALADGGVPGVRTTWDVSGRGRYRCLYPVHREIDGRKPTSWEGVSSHDPLIGRIELKARCRRCDSCLKAKNAFWKMLAIREIEAAPRTWFVTLTFTADQQFRADVAARSRLTEAGITEPTNAELFRERFNALSPEVTKWLKRVRKGQKERGWHPLSFRYLMVAEEHKSSFPHVHLLIHELNGQTIVKRRLRETWLKGFSHARLVPVGTGGVHRDAAYVCKYITKSMLARVRASHHYGDQDIVSDNDI